MWASPRSPTSAVAVPIASSATKVPEKVQIEHLEHAATLLNTRITADSKYPDLFDLFSGTTSGDYTEESTPNFLHKQNFLLPDPLLEQYNFLEFKCFMGLFPEINRAWLTIDNRLFLWNYTDGNDFQSFDELDQVIVSVALVKPKSGVFISEVKFLLVIATPVEVVLLGVAVNPGRGGLVLYPTQLSVSSDNVNNLCAVGLKNGRIFLGGRDGHVRELIYQAEDGWFTRRCRTVNLTQNTLSVLVPSFISLGSEDPIFHIMVDEQRGILYTLSEKNVVQVFYLGEQGSGFTRCVVKSDIREDAQRLYPQTPLLDAASFRLLSLHAIQKSESARVHLVALTSTGLRLYFTTFGNEAYALFPGGASSTGLADNRPPTTLGLLHIRSPPSPRSMFDVDRDRHGTVASALPSIFNKVHTAFYSRGIFLFANAVSDERDILAGVNPDISQISKVSSSRRVGLIEVNSETSIQGKTWAIAENTPASSLLSPSSADERYKLNELVIQHQAPQRDFLCLTNTGLHILSKLRPLDHLRQLLADSNGQITNPIKVFFDRYSRDESCSMCLCVASLGGTHTTQLATVADQLRSVRSPSRVVGDQPIVRFATYIFFHLGGEPIMTEQRTRYEGSLDVYMGHPIAAPEIMYSGAHNGLCIYFSRIVRSIWKQPTTKVANVLGPVVAAADAPLSEAVGVAVEQLRALRDFLDRNVQFAAAPRPADPLRPRMNFQVDPHLQRLQEEAQKVEQQSLYSLQLLLNRSLEALSFLSMLNDHNISELLKSVQPPDLLNLTFEALVTSERGRELAKQLVTALMNKQIGSSFSVDAVSDVLRQRCPSFLSADEIILFKAMEMLLRARESSIVQERDSLLKDSLKYFRQVIGIISPDKLKSICEDYIKLRFHPGAVDLTLYSAHETDPTGLGLQYAKEGCPSMDAREPYYKRRINCYENVLLALKDLKNLPKGQSSSMPLSGEEIERSRLSTYQRALSANDELFHVTLYEWLIEEGLESSVLLEVQTPFIEPYLERQTKQRDLLWKYYIKHGQFARAAMALAALAEAEDPNITLDHRLEYLSRAVTAAKSCTTTSTTAISRELMEDLEAKLEVANIQRLIYSDIIQNGSDLHIPAEAIRVLNDRLFNISDLYNDYTRRYRLSECSIAVLDCSGHRDPALVERLWADIIQKEHNIDALAAKIKELARRYFPSDNVFPLFTICHLLEQYNVRSGTPPDVAAWVVATLADVGVPYGALFDVYSQLFERPEWKSSDAFLHLAVVLQNLIESWLNKSGRSNTGYFVPNGDAFAANTVDETLSKVIVKAEQVAAPGARTLAQHLKNLQHSIRVNF